MSLVLRPQRPASLRPLALATLIVAAMLPSTLSFAPTFAVLATEAAHRLHCKCAHCPGAAKCCCHGDSFCLPEKP